MQRNIYVFANINEALVSSAEINLSMSSEKTSRETIFVNHVYASASLNDRL